MNAPAVAVIIPFRDRGFDPRRHANLLRVLDSWSDFAGQVRVCDDGRDGNTQFCRSAAYNNGVRHSDADVYVFAESDMLISVEQIQRGIELAQERPGLVIPFTEYHYLSSQDSDRVREYKESAALCTPESTMNSGTSVGAINIVSRAAMELVGQWDEAFEGSWYDDRAMCRAFEVTCSPTRWVHGLAYHLYHLPGWKGSHVTQRDRNATISNQQRYNIYNSTHSPAGIRQLTAGGNV